MIPCMFYCDVCMRLWSQIYGALEMLVIIMMIIIDYVPRKKGVKHEM